MVLTLFQVIDLERNVYEAVMKFSIIPATILAIMTICPMAYADSFCGFDERLIGTKAIGSVSPRQLESLISETDICMLNLFDTPNETNEQNTTACMDIQYLPSRFFNYEEEGFDPLASDYFQFQAFDADGIWVQLALKTGQRKWAKQKNINPERYPYYHTTDDAPVFVNRKIPTQTGIYDEPRLDKPSQYKGQQLGHLTDDWIDYTIPLGLFNHDIFKRLETYGVFNSSHIEVGKLATHYGEFLYAAYDVKAIIKDKEGREWLKAEEFLDVAPFDFWHFVAKELDAQGKKLSRNDRELIDSASYDETFRSDAGRTVYFPYREPSGTITMVMTDGPDCD